MMFLPDDPVVVRAVVMAGVAKRDGLIRPDEDEAAVGLVAARAFGLYRR